MYEVAGAVRPLKLMIWLSSLKLLYELKFDDWSTSLPATSVTVLPSIVPFVGPELTAVRVLEPVPPRIWMELAPSIVRRQEFHAVARRQLPVAGGPLDAGGVLTIVDDQVDHFGELELRQVREARVDAIEIRSRSAGPVISP